MIMLFEMASPGVIVNRVFWHKRYWDFCMAIIFGITRLIFERSSLIRP